MSKGLWSTELELYNCGLDHDVVDEMVRSQWQKKSKSKIYLLYRWLVAIFVTVVVVWSFVENALHRNVGLFFIYLTHWGIMMNMIVGVMGAILVTIWHFHPDFKENVLRTEEMPTSFKIYWALHNIALTTSVVITIIYWSFLHTEKRGLKPLNILCHACNSAIMLFDICLVAHPMRLYHMVQPLALALVFSIFSYIYYLFDGKNIEGEPYIYHILDWSKPGKTLLMVLGVMILAVIIHFLLFWVYKLRVFVYRRFFVDSSTPNGGNRWTSVRTEDIPMNQA